MKSYEVRTKGQILCLEQESYYRVILTNSKQSDNKNQAVPSSHTKILAQQKASLHGLGATARTKLSPVTRPRQALSSASESAERSFCCSWIIPQAKAGYWSLLFWLCSCSARKESPWPPTCCSSELLTPRQAAPRRGHWHLFSSLLQTMPLVPQTALETSPNRLGG